MPEEANLISYCWTFQSIMPQIIVIDTGSPLQSFEMIQGKVERIPDINLQEAISLCETRYLLLTHIDIFPKDQRLIEWFIKQRKKVLGYRIADYGKWIHHKIIFIDLKTKNIQIDKKMIKHWSDANMLFNYDDNTVVNSNDLIDHIIGLESGRPQAKKLLNESAKKLSPLGNKISIKFKRKVG